MTNTLNVCGTVLRVLGKIVCGTLDIASFLSIMMLLSIADFEEGAWPIMVMMLAAPVLWVIVREAFGWSVWPMEDIDLDEFDDFDDEDEEPVIYYKNVG